MHPRFLFFTGLLLLALALVRGWKLWRVRNAPTHNARVQGLERKQSGESFHTEITLWIPTEDGGMHKTLKAPVSPSAKTLAVRLTSTGRVVWPSDRWANGFAIGALGAGIGCLIAGLAAG